MPTNSKENNMKNNWLKKLLILLSFKTTFFAVEAYALPQTWVDDNLKVVTVLPSNVLKVQLIEYDAGENMYGGLNFEWTYSYEQARQELEMVKKNYPDFEVRRVSIEKIPKGLKLEVPSLSLSKDLSVKASNEGYYATGEVMLSKKQFNQLKLELSKSQMPVRLIGTVTTTYFKGKLLERVFIKQEHCDALLRNGNTVGGAIESMAAYSALIEKNGLVQLSKTKKSLISKIQRTCFDIVGEANVHSFHDLLSLKLNAKRLDSPVEVSTVEESREETELPVGWTLQIGN
jgi:hypothetical protein